jgi:hypothetical protein
MIYNMYFHLGSQSIGSFDVAFIMGMLRDIPSVSLAFPGQLPRWMCDFVTKKPVGLSQLLAEALGMR